MNRNFESHGDIVGKNVSLKKGDFSELFKGLKSGLITQTPAAREGMKKALEAENYRKLVKQGEAAVKGLDAYNKTLANKAAYDAVRSQSFQKQADLINKQLADVNKKAEFWNAGMQARVDTINQEAANKYVNHVADLRASRVAPTTDQIAAAGQKANELQSSYIDKVLSDPSHQARAKALEQAYANTDQGKIISDAKALADKKIANEQFWTKKAQEHAAKEQASMTEAVNNYEKIKQTRLAQDKFDHTLVGKVKKGAGNIKDAAVQGFQGLSGKVQNMTGLSANAANIATGASLGLAAAGLIGGGIALHKHLKKKKAAKARAGYMSQRDFDAWNPIDSLKLEKKTRNKWMTGVGAGFGAINGAGAGLALSILKGGDPAMYALGGAGAGALLGGGALRGWSGLENHLRGKRDDKIKEAIRMQQKSGIPTEDIVIPKGPGRVSRGLITAGRTALGFPNPIAMGVNLGTGLAWQAANKNYDANRDAMLKNYYISNKD